MKIPKKINVTPIEREAVIASAQEDAQALIACGDGFIPENVGSVPEVGSRFAIDLLLPEGIETGDSREFELGSIDSREFPLPLYWQIATGDGHGGSVIVGRIDYAERLGDTEVESLEFADSVSDIADDENTNEEIHTGTIKGWGNAVGVFDSGPYGREAERLVRGGFLRGVSADLDKFEASVELAAEGDDDDPNAYKDDKLKVSRARLMGATLLGKPAFQECSIRLIEDELFIEELPIEDGMYEEAIDDPEFTFAALAASAAPVVPPRTWFDRPTLKGPTPITVTDEGQVFGHIAAWNVDHIGLPRATKPPRSHSNYAYFRTGVLRTDNGSDIPVGQLTLAGGHAGLSLSAAGAAKHYDDTASAVADVTAGEDAFGIWVAGAIRPEATPTQIRALRASAPSGDWRPINGRLELVAVCQVNVPGFPVARAMVSGGQMMALVAAGARPLAELRTSPTSDINERLARLEKIELEKERAAAFALIQPLIDEQQEALVAAAEVARKKMEPLLSRQEMENVRKAEEARKLILGE